VLPSTPVSIEHRPQRSLDDRLLEPSVPSSIDDSSFYAARPLPLRPISPTNLMTSPNDLMQLHSRVLMASPVLPEVDCNTHPVGDFDENVYSKLQDYVLNDSTNTTKIEIGGEPGGNQERKNLFLAFQRGPGFEVNFEDSYARHLGVNPDISTADSERSVSIGSAPKHPAAAAELGVHLNRGHYSHPLFTYANSAFFGSQVNRSYFDITPEETNDDDLEVTISQGLLGPSLYIPLSPCQDNDPPTYEDLLSNLDTHKEALKMAIRDRDAAIAIGSQIFVQNVTLQNTNDEQAARIECLDQLAVTFRQTLAHYKQMIRKQELENHELRTKLDAMNYRRGIARIQMDEITQLQEDMSTLRSDLAHFIATDD
jgi:hypothetical protein